MGIFAIGLGSVLLILAERNLVDDSQKRKTFDFVYLYAASLILLQFCIVLTEYSFANKQHSYEYYKFSAIIYGFIIITFSQASKRPFSATIIAVLFFIHRLLILWILPLFEAEPLLGPIYRPIDHYVAPPFPPLLLIPAVIIDLYRQKFNTKNNVIKAVVLGIIFGPSVPFIGTAVVDNISGLVSSLGGAGLVGIITLGILYWLAGR